MADSITKLVEDWVSLRGASRHFSEKLNSTLSAEVFLNLARISKQLWGVNYKLSTLSMDDVAKTLKANGTALEKIYQASLKSGKRISRVKVASPKAKKSEAKGSGLSFLS